MSLSQRIEKNLICQCSPTLASLKTASLFTIDFTCRGELSAALRKWNRDLSDKGVALIPLQEKNGKALIYVFRKDRLKKILSSTEIEEFLHSCGYCSCGIGAALSTLRSRLKGSAEFPHEIGIFLGYPIGDVVGFIRCKGKNCKCTGCWKVYCDERAAAETFARYKKCKAVYMRLWEQGRSVHRLTVSA